MKKLCLGLTALTLLIGSNAFALTYECGTDLIPSKEKGYVYVKTESEVISIDASPRFVDVEDERTLYISYKVQVDDVEIQRRAYLNKKLARENNSGILNNYEENYFAKITDEVGDTKISLSLDMLDVSLKGKISLNDSKENIRIHKGCSEHVLKSLHK